MPNGEESAPKNSPQAIHLRREAQPFAYGDLKDTQKQAYKRTLEYVQSAISLRKDDSGKGHPTPAIGDLPREDRASRLVFLSGARGTGKTTVLLSLQKDLHLCLEEDKRPENYDDDCWKLLQHVAPKIIWLEQLDMEVLPDSVNLLACIFSRIDEAVKRFNQLENMPEDLHHSPSGLLAPHLHNGLIELQHLESDVGLAWEGNLSARAGSVDPDIYAVEVIRAEQVRLRLNQRLSKVLDTLAKTIPRAYGLHDPIFLLPIDDFDVNPPTCLPLLRLLRLISVPRLFTIVLGDIEIATKMLNLRISGDIARVIAPTSGLVPAAMVDHNMLSIPATEIGNIAGEIAFNALRKLIPPTQRIHLELLKPGEAINSKFSEDVGSKPIKELLERINVYFHIFAMGGDIFKNFKEGGDQEEIVAKVAGEEIENLKQFIFVEKLRYINGKNDIPDTDIYAYSGSGVLRGSLRGATDFASQITLLSNEIKEIQDSMLNVKNNASEGIKKENYNILERKAKRISGHLLDFIAKFCQQILEEDGALAAIERQLLPLALGTYMRPTTLTNFDILPIELLAETHDERRLTSFCQDVSEVNDQGEKRLWAHIVVNRHRRFAFRVLASDSNRSGPRSGLRIDTGSALVLYHDLLILTREQEEAGESKFSPGKYIKQLSDTGVSPKDTSSGMTKSLDGQTQNGPHKWCSINWKVGRADDRGRVSWPLPRWRTFWEFDLFLDAWNKVVDHVSSTTYDFAEEEVIEVLALFWISTATAILGGKKHVMELILEEDEKKQDSNRPVQEWIRRARERCKTRKDVKEAEKAIIKTEEAKKSTKEVEKAEKAQKRLQEGNLKEQQEWEKQLKLRWQKLFEDIIRILEENSTDAPRGRRINDWVIDIFLFTQPAFGLGEDTRKRLVEYAKETKVDDMKDTKANCMSVSIWEKWFEAFHFLKDTYCQIIDQIGIKANVVSFQDNKG